MKIDIVNLRRGVPSRNIIKFASSGAGFRQIIMEPGQILKIFRNNQLLMRPCSRRAQGARSLRRDNLAWFGENSACYCVSNSRQRDNPGLRPPGNPNAANEFSRHAGGAPRVRGKPEVQPARQGRRPVVLAGDVLWDSFLFLG